MRRLWTARFVRNKGYLPFILPALILYTLFVVYPIVTVIPLSVTSYSGIGAKAFVGFKNFSTLFTNPVISKQFFHALLNNGKIILINLFIINPVIFVLAYFLYKGIPGNRIFKMVIFSPYFASSVSLSFMITFFFNPQLGLYSSVMRVLGLSRWAIFPWMADPAYAIPYLMLVWTWMGMGYEILIYISNFNMVPMELVEAAKIDGAGEWKRFLHVYIPMMYPAITNITVLMYIWGISAFDMCFTLGGTSGGVGGSMDVLGLFFYRTAFSSNTFPGNTMGMGAAVSVVMLILISVGAFFMNRLLRDRITEQ